MYYDETNNYRKFKLDPDKDMGFNASEALYKDFTLGGIALPPGRELDTGTLLKDLGLSKANEIKSKHIMRTGEFPCDLGSKRALTFLKWMSNNEIIIHFTSLNSLYDALIDLVDEAVLTDDSKFSLHYHAYIKEQLFYFVMRHLPEFTEILLRYGFPNIKDNTINPFCQSISDLIQNNVVDDSPEDFYLELFRQEIKAVSRRGNMIFLKDSEPFVLVDDYSSQYWQSIINYPNAHHVFDYERTVLDAFDKIELMDHWKVYDGFEFVHSTDNVYVQISDVFVGILARYFHFADSLFLESETRSIPLPSKDQLLGFHYLYDILERSVTFFDHLVCDSTALGIKNHRYALLKQLNKLWILKNGE